MPSINRPCTDPRRSSLGHVSRRHRADGAAHVGSSSNAGHHSLPNTANPLQPIVSRRPRSLGKSRNGSQGEITRGGVGAAVAAASLPSASAGTGRRGGVGHDDSTLVSFITAAVSKHHHHVLVQPPSMPEHVVVVVCIQPFLRRGVAWNRLLRPRGGIAHAAVTALRQIVSCLAAIVVATGAGSRVTQWDPLAAVAVERRRDTYRFARQAGAISRPALERMASPLDAGQGLPPRWRWGLARPP